MIAGHTKFAPDGHFGKIKAHVRRYNVASMLRLTKESGLIRTSASNNYDIPDVEPHSGDHNFDFYD